ncbi:MAG: glycoside hydrolase family 13 protein, partial [Actinomycetota bacterium]|nr:glycoside hydrolase family 13 protein [Actinomycetota bacterium]
MTAATGPVVPLHCTPHHDGSPLYTANAHPALGERVRVWVRVPAEAAVHAVYLRTRPDDAATFTAAEIDTERTGRPVGGYGGGHTWWTVQVPVHNPVSRYRFLLATNAGTRWLQASGVHAFDVTDNDDFRLTAYDPGPAWASAAVVYEIFPDRFARGGGATSPPQVADWAVACGWDTDPVQGSGPLAPRQIYGGDLDGIVEHLDHIAGLGANTIYLRPVFPAESNHRYNASTFDTVDPIVGGVPALRRLTDALHARGMRLIGDITTNHCGDTHEWFRRAIADPAAAERDMFYFALDGSYESWYGVPSLPKLNWRSQLVRDKMTAVVRRWLEFYDGWRVDVANMTGRLGPEDCNHEVAQLIRDTVRTTRTDAALVAEHMFDASADLDDGGWDGTMNYAGFLRPVWTWLAGEDAARIDFLDVPGGVPRRGGTAALSSLRAFAAQTSWNSCAHSWQLLDSYDCARIRSVVGSRERHIVAAGLQATLPGVPMVTAGSEYGLTADSGEWGRIPMPWNRPADRDEQLHTEYRSLFGLRAAHIALREGGLRWWYADSDTLIFSREHSDGSVLVQARRASGSPVTLPLDASL